MSTQRRVSSGGSKASADVLFGQSYFLRFDPKLWQAMQPYPPLGSLLAAAVVREAGYRVECFDAMLAEDERAWQSRLGSARPRYAVVFEDNFNYLSKMCLSRMREACFRMLGMANQAGCTSIVCGSDASDHAAEYLEAGARYVLLGEGEATLVELLAALDRGGDTSAISGLAQLEGGKVIQTPRRSVLRQLDELPLPAWDLIDLEPYRQRWQRRHGRFSLNLVTTRGCPYHCNWCAKPIWGQTYNMRSAAHVADEMAWVRERYGADHIWFADDIFGLKKGWIARLADALEERGQRIPYKCLSRVDLLLRDGEIDALERSGCEVVWVGAESGSQAVLDAMEKGTTVEQIREASRRLRESSVRVGFFLQFGYPGETKADVEATLALVEECRPHEIGMSVSYPLPGTSFHERVRGLLGEKQNWVDSSDLDLLYEAPFDASFYRQVVRTTQKAFRLQRAKAALRDVLSNPASLRPTHARRLAALGVHAVTLPWERWRMQRLAVPSGNPVPPLVPRLNPEQAATASAQTMGAGDA